MIYFTGWMPIDPILSLFISLLLLVFTLNLVRDIVHTLRSDGKAKKAGALTHEH